jgi:CubicO group peptidase (beta-lactamase class C family)
MRASLMFESNIISRLRELLTYWSVPGLSVSIGYQGKILVSEAYGYADLARGIPMRPDHRFRIGSITKLFTATCCLKLVEDGILSLDCPIFELFRKKGYMIGELGDPRVANITLRHLLNHSSGLPWTVGHPACAETMQAEGPYSAPRPLVFAPGTSQQYSTFAYTVVGRLVTAYAGTFHEYLQRSILEPGGLSSVVVGRTDRANRPDNEVAYYSTVNGRPEEMEGFEFDGKYIEARDSTGGLIATTSDIVRMVMQLEGSAQPVLLRSSSIKEMIKGPIHNKSEKSYLGMGCHISVNECGMLDRINGRLSGVRLSQNGRSAGVIGNIHRSPQGYICAAFLNGIGENSENMDRQLLHMIVDGFKR